MASKIISGIIVSFILAVVALLQGQGIIPDSMNPVANGDVYVHIIDVGQGSSTLIQQGHEGILIDAGEADYALKVSDYIISCGIDKLKYVVASHPHSDHIGGLPYIIRKFDIGEILMPEIAEENLPTTKVYERFLDAIEEKDVPASYCEVGDVYSLGDIKLEILGPVAQVSDLNNMSAICKVSYLCTSVMIPADAEINELKSVYKHGGDFRSEIILVPHHGSRTAIYEEFFEAVNPIIAIVSCGKNNSYNHPHQEVVDYFKSILADFKRTDIDGDLIYRLNNRGFERVYEK